MSIGVVELIFILVGLILLAIPAVTLVFVFLIYSKLNNIERALSREE